MSEPKLTKFEITNLNGRQDVQLELSDNTLILVGENGTGKTTILRIIFYFLSGRFLELAKFRFDEVSATVDGKRFTLKSSAVRQLLDTKYVYRNLPSSVRDRFRMLEAEGRLDELDALSHHYYLRNEFGRHVRDFDSKAAEKLSELQNRVKKAIDAQILYLPTYRRIERELTSIYSGIDASNLRRNKLSVQAESDDAYIELVEFGMADVKKAIDTALKNISTFANAGLNTLTLGYLGEVVDRDYRTTEYTEITTASPETVSAVLNRVSDPILNEGQKSHLREIVTKARTSSSPPTEHEQIIYHYFSKLLSFQKALQDREKSMTSFCELCSSYIRDKIFVYDAQDFSFRIKWSSSSQEKPSSDKVNDVELSDLSSGEKQIVSLFSHLYLSGRSKFFVLIDEPELSLSVPWQRRFLRDIRDGDFCSGLLAVTHSPFIYDNELKSKAHGLGEFLSGPDWGNIA